MKTNSIRNQVRFLKRPVTRVPTPPPPPPPRFFSAYFAKQHVPKDFASGSCPSPPLVCLPRAAQTHSGFASLTRAFFPRLPEENWRGAGFRLRRCIRLSQEAQDRFLARPPRGSGCPETGCDVALSPPRPRGWGRPQQPPQREGPGQTRLVTTALVLRRSEQLFNPRFGLMMGSACVNTRFILPRPPPARGCPPGRREKDAGAALPKALSLGKGLGRWGWWGPLSHSLGPASVGAEPVFSRAGLSRSPRGTRGHPGWALLERRLLETRSARVGGSDALPGPRWERPVSEAAAARRSKAEGRAGRVWTVDAT